MKILKYVLGIAFALFVLGKVLAPSQGKVSAESLVQEVNKRLTLPQDLGDGFRLDSVTASGNDVVSTVTLLEVTDGQHDAALQQVLQAASISDTCREIGAAKQGYIAAGIRVVKTYRNQSGVQIASATIDPRDCP